MANDKIRLNAPQVAGGKDVATHTLASGEDIARSTIAVYTPGAGNTPGTAVDISPATEPTLDAFRTATHADLAALATDAHLQALISAVATQATLAAVQTLLGGGLPSALVGGRLAVDGSGVTQPVNGSVSVSALPAIPSGANVIGHVIVDSAGNVAITSMPNVTIGSALPAGTNVIGHVIVDSAGSVSVTSLPALPAGSNTIGSVNVAGSLPAFASTPTVNLGTIGSASTAANQTTANTSLASIDSKTPALGQALAGASSPVVLPSAQDVVAYAPAKESGGNLDTLVARTPAVGQLASTFARTIINPSNASIRVVDCTPTGNVWSTSVGLLAANSSSTAAGVNIVAAVSGQYLRQVVVLNPHNVVTLFYFLYHGAAPSWGAGSGPSIVAGSLITNGQLGTTNSANAIADLPGGLLVASGVYLVISTTSGALSNSYTAPTNPVYVTVRYGT